MRTVLALITLVSVFAGCTATEQGAVIGGASGAGLGAIIGHQSGNRGEGAAIGAAAGALMGGLVGHQIDKDKQAQAREQAYRQGQADARRDAVTAPPPQGKGNWIEGHYEYVTKKEWVDTTKTERVWVPEHTVGDRRIEGHWQERQVPSGYWREYEEKIWIPGHYE
mgnify:CR=1 FL=1